MFESSGCKIEESGGLDRGGKERGVTGGRSS